MQSLRKLIFLSVYKPSDMSLELGLLLAVLLLL
jgi:hypothetical protein